MDLYDNIDFFKEFSHHEDCSNIKNFLKDHFSWFDKSIVESGVGTGRFTDLYIGSAHAVTLCDKSNKMLEYCMKKYSETYDHVKYICCGHDHLLELIDYELVDIYLSTFSISCLVAEEKSDQFISDFLDKVLAKASTTIIIENIGIFSDNDEYIKPYQRYFHILSEKMKFHTLNVTLHFQSTKEAAYYTKQIFGEDISEKIENMSLNNIQEKIGIWYT